jgi:hypothetical protein
VAVIAERPHFMQGSQAPESHVAIKGSAPGWPSRSPDGAPSQGMPGHAIHRRLTSNRAPRNGVAP